ncbi:MAG: tetratricopeptide repeat protein [Balneolales bacterium]
MKVLIIIFTTLLAVTSCSASNEVRHNNSQINKPVLQRAPQRLMAPVDLLDAKSLYIKGITQFELGDYERSRDLLISAKSLDPESSGINYALMDVFLELDDLSNAVYYGSLAINSDPDNKWYRLKLSETYRQLGEIDEAIEQLNAILENNPNDIDILFLVASIQSNQGRYHQSNNTYDKILKLTGSERTVHYQKFQNFTNLGKTDEAIAELEEIRKLSPGNLNTLHTLSQFYLENKQSEEAKKVLNDALKMNPRDPETLVGLADIHMNEGDWQTGGEILNRVIEDTMVNPTNKVEIVEYMLSRYQFEQGNDEFFKTAQYMIETLVVKNNDFGMSHALAAKFYSMIEDYDKALNYLETTTTLMPENDSAWRQRLQYLQMENRFEETISVGLQANEYVPDDALIQFFLGSAYFLTEDYENAIKWLKSAADMPARGPFKSMILGTLGDAFASTDNWEEAYESYENALTYDSDNDVTLNNYAYYLLERDKNIEEAKAMAQKALAIKPDNASYLDTMGWIYFKLGDYEKAKEYIESALNAGSTSAEVMEHMGDVYEKLGDLDKARHWWEKALKEDEKRNHLQEKLTQN